MKTAGKWPGGGHWFTPVVVRLVLILFVFVMFIVATEGLLSILQGVYRVLILRSILV